MKGIIVNMKKTIKKNLLRLIIIFIIVFSFMLLQTGKSNAATTYTVTFDSNGGSQVPSQIVNSGESPIVPDDPTKDKLSFYCWSLNGSSIWNLDELEVTSNITLIAEWVAWYSIGCEENGKVALKDEQGVEPSDSEYGGGFGGLVHEGDTRYYWAKADDGYEFKEWQNQSDNTLYSKNNPIELKSGTTPGFQVKAVFKESANPKFTVTFDTKGGSIVESQIINKGEKAIRPSNPTKNGFEFENWYADEERTQLFNFNTPIMTTTTIYAKWTPTTAVPYTVTFDSNGGSSVPSQVVYEGEQIVEPEKPTKDKLTFNVWTLNGSSVWNLEQLEVTSDITLVAEWVTWYSVGANENGNVGSSNKQNVEPSQYGGGFGGLVYEGDTMYFWAKPNNGYKFKEWQNQSDDTTYSKSNPIVLKSGTTLGFQVKAVFEKEVPFTDVKEGSWYYNAVKYVYGNNIMSGLNSTSFGPTNKLTRGMMVSILYKMEGSPKVTTASNFTDVQDSSKYYYKPVIWASKNNIVSGYNNGKFGPTDNITREQLAVILYKYAKYKGKDISKTTELTSFSDSNKVASYALKQVKWAVASGVITGSSGKLNPKGNATRAEVAAMMEKYCKKVGK